jgi:flagellar hook protein FlgE
MGIYGALSSAVTGLRAQAHALENISGNIANSQTTGYKRIETDFLDLIPDAPISRQVPGAVLAQSRGTNAIQGDIKTVSNETFIALNSNGFFVVEPKVGQSDGNAVFAGTNFFTRRGDFEIDKDGMLVNGAGYYLKGLPIDTRTGNISGSVPEVIKLSNSFLPAQQTNRINYQANLPQLPKNGGYKPTVFNSELMQAHKYDGSAWQTASITGTVPMTPVPVTATVNGSTVFDGTDLANAVFGDTKSLTFAAGAATRTINFTNTSTIDGNVPFDGAVDLASAVLNDTSTLTFTAGGTTAAIEFDSGAPASATNLHIAGMTMNQALASIQAAVQAVGGGLSNAQVSLNGSNQVRATLGTNLADTLQVTGNAVGALGLNAAQSATRIHVTPTMTMTQALAAIQTAVRSGAAGELSTAEVGLNADGEVRVALGSNTDDSLVLSGAGTSLADIGLGAGTTPRTLNSAAETYMPPGQKISLNINGTDSTYEFYNTATYAGTDRGIDVSGSITQALANLQAAIRANGGASAATATVGLDGTGRLQITLGTDHYASFSVTEGDSSMGLAVGNSTAPVRSDVDFVSANQDKLFVSNSIAGGAVTAYAENGAPANVQMRWAKVSSTQAGGAADTWHLFYMSDSNAQGGSPMWSRVNSEFRFDADGSLAFPTDGSVQLNNLTINGTSVGDVEFRFDTNGLSQFADVNGTANVSMLNQNGYGAGEFVSVAINDNGRVVATYSNGERIDMAQVVTAEFNAINKLKRLDGGVFSSTSESGEAILDLSGSGVIGGALEASNTDISDEFTKLIVTQQAYAAGTRIVSTADEMLQEALNMIR